MSSKGLEFRNKQEQSTLERAKFAAAAIIEAIDAKTGEQLWKHNLPGPIRGGMSIANGTLYTSTGTSVDWNVRDLRAEKKWKLYAFSPDGQ